MRALFPLGILPAAGKIQLLMQRKVTSSKSFPKKQADFSECPQHGVPSSSHLWLWMTKNTIASVVKLTLLRLNQQWWDWIQDLLSYSPTCFLIIPVFKIMKTYFKKR
jgi:hypothetical protein